MCSNALQTRADRTWRSRDPATRLDKSYYYQEKTYKVGLHGQHVVMHVPPFLSLSLFSSSFSSLQPLTYRPSSIIHNNLLRSHTTSRSLTSPHLTMDMDHTMDMGSSMTMTATSTGGMSSSTSSSMGGMGGMDMGGMSMDMGTGSCKVSVRIRSCIRITQLYFVADSVVDNPYRCSGTGIPLMLVSLPHI